MIMAGSEDMAGAGKGEHGSRFSAKSPTDSGRSGGGGGRDQVEEAAGLETRAADQPAVDVLLAEELRGIGRLHRAAVEDAHPPGHRLGEELGQEAADEGVDLLRLL